MDNSAQATLLGGLNDKQKEAVLHTEGALLVLSGAGSGKTKVITHRIAHLLEKNIPEYNILAITFTNKAAREMKERLEKILGRENKVWISTFHGMCVRMLRQDIYRLGYDNNFTIYDAQDSERLMKECIKELNLDEKLNPAKSMMYQIGELKNSLISPQAFEKQHGNFREETVSKIYTSYQDKLKQNNALDFDDIISKTIELFQAHMEVVERYQQKFKYIMVDEYQDTNTAQYTLVSMLADGHGNLCVVGDDDQSIYGWRGADIRNILEFEKDFNNAKVIKMEQNYRSTSNILDAANSVILNNAGRKEKKLWTDNEQGERITFYSADSDFDEGAYVATAIKERAESGSKYSDFGILYRQNSLSRTIEEQLARRGIPYRIFGGLRFYDRKEIKDVLAYLKAIHNPLDSVSLRRIVNVPKRGIGDSSVDKVSAYALEQGISLYDAMKDCEWLGSRSKKFAEFIELMEDLKQFAQNNNVEELINEILNKTKYIQDLEKDDQLQSRQENIRELVNKAVEFEKIIDEPSLSAFLEDVSLVADIDNYSEDADTATLMTVHSSKGLEFPSVFIVGFEDGIFPSIRSNSTEKDMEEERRLCYVGITRAREKLYITSSMSRLHNGKTVYNLKSRFLKEIDKSLLTYANKSEKKPGISQFAGIKVFNSEKPRNVGQSYKTDLPAPTGKKLDFEVGDTVNQIKYGNGIVKAINPAGADYEVTVEFEDVGAKKFMAFLSNLKKV